MPITLMSFNGKKFELRGKKSCLDEDFYGCGIIKLYRVLLDNGLFLHDFEIWMNSTLSFKKFDIETLEEAEWIKVSGFLDIEYLIGYCTIRNQMIVENPGHPIIRLLYPSNVEIIESRYKRKLLTEKNK